MAPEVVIGRARPSRETDYFSLSVLLFYLFHIQHPFVGKKILAIRSWDLPARERLFGLEPVFIFDPIDKSNEAIDSKQHDPLGEAGKNAMPYWNRIYPRILRDAFVTSFTEGIRRPEKRIVGSSWKKVLSESRDSIFQCEACLSENFYDRFTPSRSCWKCNKTIRPKFFLLASNRKIALSNGTKIEEYHVRNSAFESNSALIAQVVPHPTRSGVFGLCNRTTSSWIATVEGNQTLEVLPGKSVPLHSGTEIKIGNQSVSISES